MLYARVVGEARRLSEAMKGGRVRKFYIAKVRGRMEGGACKANIGCVDMRRGRFGVMEEGKASESRFTLICYDEETDTSLMECQPVTGRTHQLRVHLQHMGHPIDDDVKYGGKQDTAPAPLSPLPPIEREEKVEVERKEGKVRDEETEEQRLRRHRRDAFDPNCAQCHDPAVYALANVTEKQTSPDAIASESTASANPSDVDEDVDAADELQVSSIHLHAWQYIVDDSTYEVDWPEWAGGVVALQTWLQKRPTHPI